MTDLRHQISAAPDPLVPPASLLCKLASVAVHAEEATGPNSHPVDWQALATALNDIEVQTWLRAMTTAGMAPVKRS